MIGCEKYALYDRALPVTERKYFNSVNEADQPTDEQAMQKIRVMSAVFAQTFSGVAYVLVEGGKSFSPASTWVNYEYPNLTAPGSAVTAINFLRWPSMREQILWQEGDLQQGVWPPADEPWDIFGG